jgi:hypothetical protein
MAESGGRDGAPSSDSARTEDRVVRHARRESVIICVVWALAAITTCTLSYWLGYDRPGQTLGPADVRPIAGMPLWFVWGVLCPWAACAVFTWWFAGFFMKEDDLGSDHSAELERDIREVDADA